jgi:hypothetical protein
MRRAISGDNTAYPLTDLMTSLMVIFVLLLLVFLNNQASGRNSPSAASLTRDISQSLNLSPSDVKVIYDSRDFYTVVIDTPIRFQAGQSDLNAEGASFLTTEFPKLAQIVCGDRYPGQIDELIVEGQSDGTLFRGLSREQSLNENLRLGEDRAMVVVRQSVHPLESSTKDCLADRITASGKVRPESESESIDSRRVQFKVRMRSELAMAGLRRLGVARDPASARIEEPRPEVLKVLELFRQLRIVPRQPVSFRLSQDEINTYMVYALNVAPRPGVESIQIKLFANNYVSTLVRLDLDALEKKGAGAILAPFHLLLNGRKDLWLDFRFSVRDAQMTFTVEKAYYQNTKLPAIFVTQLIRLAGTLQPEHLDTSKPIPLPFNLRSLRTENGVILGSN